MRMFTRSDCKAEAHPDALSVPDGRMPILPPLPYFIVQVDKLALKQQS